jgi:serine/threonine protein kinase
MGLFLRLPFQPKQLLPINADFYFDKGNYGIVIYMNKEYSKVVKFVQTTTFSGIQKLEKEVKSLKIANVVNHPKVKTATINNVVKDENLNYFEQDLIFANDLHSLSKKNLKEVYEDVFDFMLMFYTKCGIKTVSLSDNNFEIDEILQYVETLKNGSDILKKVKELKSKNKRLLQTCVHGDLSLNNILIDKNKTIWIIDWGESDEEYLAKDFKNDNFDTSLLYNTIVNQLSLDKNELYSLEDQIFIQDYTEMLSLIYNQIIEKHKDVHFTSKLNAIINRMSITNK